MVLVCLRYNSNMTFTFVFFDISFYKLSRPWPVFRARHGSRIVCMSVTLKLITKLTAGEPIWHIVPAFSDGPRSISLAWRKQVEKLIGAPARQTQGLRSKLWVRLTVAAPLVATSGWMIRVYDQRRDGVVLVAPTVMALCEQPACAVGSLARV